jgi:F-type H+-transporting ATPase subunit gamma
MSDKLEDVKARLDTVKELSGVVAAMRGVAAARSREALARLPGVRACAEQIGAAIADAMALEPPPGAASPPPRPEHPRPAQLLIAIGAEQGFVGTFNHRIVQAAQNAAVGATQYFVIGNRACLAAAESGLRIAWSAEMIVQADAAPQLANRIVDALYGCLSASECSRVTLIHGVPRASSEADVVTTPLLPFDFARFSPGVRAFAPLITLPVRQLQERLAEEYIYTQVCEALVLSFAAENEARMRAMIAARRNIDDTAQRLTRDYQRLRQDQITAEIVKLSSVDDTRLARNGANP